MSIDGDALKEMAAWMIQAKVQRFKFVNDDGQEMEIWLHDSAFVGPPPQVLELQQESAEPTQCRCGHDLETEHNQAGCLLCVGHCGEDDGQGS